MNNVQQHIMIDIETLGTKPGSVIFSIGACRFTEQDRDEVKVYDIDLQSCENIGLTFDAATVDWWLQTVRTIPEMSSLTGNHRITIQKALVELSCHIDRVGHPIGILPEDRIEPIIWAMPAHFDIVLLESAYRKANLRIPWEHRKVRCARTLFEFFGVNKEDFRTGKKHTVTSDVQTQIAAVQHIMRQRKECKD